ncbi:MAG: o-succinylbenzoate--CoA ligase [Gammaproteobacteria bacterium]|nr:o-succinylbenzoate--CoA ligase [Gammaproteobacteria bacterium]
MAAPPRPEPAPAVIPCPVAAAAARAPGDAAIITPQGSLDYGGLHRRCAALAATLEHHGIVPGTRVGVLAAPGADAIALLWALGRRGTVACPVSHRLPPALTDELLGDLEVELVVTDRPWQGRRVAALPLADLVTAAAGLYPDGAAGNIRLGMAQPATVLFTSGSSGRPKAVLHEVANHWYSALGANANLPLAPGDRWLLALPLFHAGGLAILWRAALAGAAVVVDAPETTLEATLERLAPTHLSLVPTQLWRLLREPAARLTMAGIKAVLVGGDAAPPGLVAEARARGLPLLTTYGCTEAASQVTATALGNPAPALATSGRVLPHRRIAIAADGEILVGGRTLARGYITDRGLQPLTDAAGWFHTGDVGTVDENGRLRVAGRRDNMFISGGENIHPEAIEAALNDLPGVARSIVVGVPDEEFGHRPAAFVEMADGTPADIADIHALLRAAGRLARFMWPVRVLPWPPETPQTGIKPDRRVIRG